MSTSALKDLSSLQPYFIPSYNLFPFRLFDCSRCFTCFSDSFCLPPWLFPVRSRAGAVSWTQFAVAALSWSCPVFYHLPLLVSFRFVATAALELLSVKDEEKAEPAFHFSRPWVAFINSGIFAIHSHLEQLFFPDLFYNNILPLFPLDLKSTQTLNFSFSFMIGLLFLKSA